VNDSKQNTRERILATARQLYGDPDASSPSMDDIASAASVGRATLYRHFSTRDELLLSVLEEEASTIAERVAKRIRHIESPSEHIIEGMLEAMVEINKNKLLTAIFQSGTSGALNRLLFDTDRLINIGIAIMSPVVERARQSGGLNSHLEFELLVEWILRMLLSLVTIPSKNLKNRAAVRRLLNATMLPVLEETAPTKTNL